MDTKKERRDRLVTLTFVSILLLAVYGPGAPWFEAADRMLYDMVAGRASNSPLDDGVIVSIDPASTAADGLIAEFGRIVRIAQEQGARRVIIPKLPPVAADSAFPDWVEGMAHRGPVFVPRDHPFALRATKSGFFELRLDRDGVLRNSQFWQLIDGVMTPSLLVAVALENPQPVSDPRLSKIEDTMYLSSYAPLDRISADDLLTGRFADSDLRNKTVFVDAEPPAMAATLIPSGQYVTHSEIAAAVLADVEMQRTIVAPVWVAAIEWLTPALLAIVAVLFLPDRKRRQILVLTTAIAGGLVLVEIMLLHYLRVRMDLGRPILIFVGAGLLAGWLSGAIRKQTKNSFKRGTDFLAAGRLEPAFAEFRRCEPNETVAGMMYKLSLAFEGQSKPERAEAVLNWLKQTQSDLPSNDKPQLGKAKGVPERLGRYVIARRLGKGAMGAVYLAKDPRINRSVALKVIPLEKEFEDEELAEARVRFFREAESAGRLTHPNIVTVYDAGEDKHLAFIAMEYLQGTALTRFTDPQKLLAPTKALELCARTAEALDYAHNQGVIHRDIKPANILYNLRDDTLKISDFGVARMTDNNRTKTGIVLGTPMYMSPEQLNAEQLTGHSDLFSLGVTLYELLTGEVPFKASNIAVLMTKITTEDPAPVSNRRAGVPPSVDAVLLKALAKKPGNRFSNGGEMAIALRNCARYAS